MRKVSRSMLATIAALQSGAHTRRKVRYIRERAMLSNMYPLDINDKGVTNSGIISSISLMDVLKSYVSPPGIGVLNAGKISCIMIGDSKSLYDFKETGSVSSSGKINAILLRDSKVSASQRDDEAITNNGDVTSIYLQKVLITSKQSDGSVTGAGSVSNISIWSE